MQAAAGIATVRAMVLPGSMAIGPQAATQSGGIGRLVLWEQPAKHRAGVRIDEMDLGEVHR